MAKGLLGGTLPGLGADTPPTLGGPIQFDQWGGPPVAPENNELSHYKNYLDAIKELKLTPEEKNLYQHDLDNLGAHREVYNPDGSVSTILQRVVENKGRFYNVPSVWDGKILPTEDAARERSAKLGWDHWPSYATPEEADARYMAMHEYLGRPASTP